MKPHPRIRKTIKWGGAVVTVLLVGVWAMSGYWAISWHTRRGNSIAVIAGCVVFNKVDPSGSDIAGGWWANRNETEFRWTYDRHQISRHITWLLPLWWFIFISLLASAAAWRLDTLARSREQIGRCPKCNYERAGLGAGVVCPECGARA